VETVHEPLLVLDEHLEILSANRSCYETFEIPQDIESPQCFDHLLQNLCAIPAFYKRIKAVASTNNELCDYEFTFQTQSGRQTEILLNARQLRQPPGQPRCILLAMEDITERKKMENEIKRHRDHLEELVARRTADLTASNEELESYSYSIAHDLRTPLRAITSFSQILNADISAALKPEHRQDLERIIAAGKKMSQLIDDILELSRISRMELRVSTVNLSKLGDEIIAELRQSHSDRPVLWHVHDALNVEGDSRLLQCALKNLLENAWKYTRGKNPARIEFGKQIVDGGNVYYVKDNGIGFDMQYKKNLFKPFQRLHLPTEFEGTGIGLATVQRVIQRHGGRVWAQAAKNQGATFFFTLPGGKTIKSAA
jgi:light-regulated signal transduction histidine kinase (bacteriophytochrome)